MSELRVVCILLTRDRPEMAARAVRCFRGQSYENKALMIYDGGDPDWFFRTKPEVMETHFTAVGSVTIGRLRNYANQNAINVFRPDIIAHLDSDDYSHPNRLAEQVTLLQSSGKQCTGYSDMLFWKECPMCAGGRGNILPYCPTCKIKYNPLREIPVGEAWLYTNRFAPRFVVGSSLMYTRKLWESRPFKDLPKGASSGEDYEFTQDIDVVSVSSLGGPPVNAPESRERTKDRSLGPNMGYGFAPRMICSIHGSNSSSQYETMEAPTWRRVPEFDAVCRERMKL